MYNCLQTQIFVSQYGMCLYSDLYYLLLFRKIYAKVAVVFNNSTMAGVLLHLAGTSLQKSLF